VVPRPIFFGSQIRAPNFNNTKDAGSTIQAAYTLTKHASIELSEATMRIVGNPNLLSSVLATSSPERLLATDASTIGDNVSSTTPTEADFAHWSYVPAFVKVKVKMPRNNDDILAFSGATSVSDQTPGNRDYAEDFWFDGYYYVIGIDHTFDSGVFSQTLHMLGIVPDEAISSLIGTSKTDGIDLTTEINNCYDSLVQCGEQVTTTTTGDGTKQSPPSTAVLAKFKPCAKLEADVKKEQTTCNKVPVSTAAPTTASTAAAPTVPKK
jgi:hypothetical protein